MNLSTSHFIKAVQKQFRQFQQFRSLTGVANSSIDGNVELDSTTIILPAPSRIKINITKPLATKEPDDVKEKPKEKSAKYIGQFYIDRRISRNFLYRGLPVNSSFSIVYTIENFSSLICIAVYLFHILFICKINPFAIY